MLAYIVNARSPVILFEQHKSTIHHKLCSSLSNLWSVYTFAQLCHDQQKQLCEKCSNTHCIARSFILCDLMDFTKIRIASYVQI